MLRYNSKGPLWHQFSYSISDAECVILAPGSITPTGAHHLIAAIRGGLQLGGISALLQGGAEHGLGAAAGPTQGCRRLPWRPGLQLAVRRPLQRCACTNCTTCWLR